MSNDERFAKFIFGTLLVLSFFVSFGRWLALLVGILFLISSVWGLCVSCKCKQALKQALNKENK